MKGGTARDTLYLPSPLLPQVPIIESGCKRKIVRAGRRFGKTRLALQCAASGHGPMDGLRRSLGGILDGVDVLWLSPDYPQSRAIWREEILPRFSGVQGITISESERRVSVQGLGELELRSAEAIDSVRGRRFGGVVVDEGAWLDLEYALNSVLLPTLADEDGWLLVISSPNGGHDGNSAKRVPSQFNLICEEIGEGGRPSWKEWHHRTEDNPTLSQQVIAELRAEYPEGSLTAQQELDALLVAGGGRFYPELLPSVVSFFIRPDELPRLESWHRFWGFFDWGFGHPSVFGNMVQIGDVTYLLDTLYMWKYQDEEQAATIKGWSDPRCLGEVYAGHDSFAVRKAHSAVPETVADVFGRYSIHMSRANIDRESGAKAVRRAFADPSKFRVVDTPGNRRVMDEASKLIPDSLNLNVPMKRDANDRGQNGDDGIDGLRYGLATYRETIEKPVIRKIPGLIETGKDEAFDDVIESMNTGHDPNALRFKIEYDVRESGPDGQFG